MNQALTYFFESPFLMLSVIVAGAFLGSCAKKLEREELNSMGFFYLITGIGVVIGWLAVIIGSIYLSFHEHWYSFLTGIGSILLGILISGLLSSPIGWISDNFSSSYKSIWIIKMYLFYCFSIVLLSVGLRGFFHYLTTI